MVATTLSEINEASIYRAPSDFAAKANLTPEKYREMYTASIADPEGFWDEQGKRLHWSKPYTQVKDVSWDKSDLHVPGTAMANSMFLTIALTVTSQPAATRSR